MTRCNKKCEGYFYKYAGKVKELKGPPEGMSAGQVDEALQNAVTRIHPFEPDEATSGCDDGCVCQPMAHPTDETTSWNEVISASFGWGPDQNHLDSRDIKFQVKITKYHDTGFCRPVGGRVYEVYDGVFFRDAVEE